MEGEPGAAGGGAPGVSPEVIRAINDQINAAFASWGKKELPKLLSTTMKDVMTQNAESIGDMVLSRIQASLPSDEEIDQMEAGAGAGEEDDAGEGQYRLPPEVLAELNDLRKNNQTFQEKMSEWEQEREQLAMQAEEENRHATIQAALNKYPFANDESREVAFRYFDQASERDQETGALVASGLPIDKFVQERMGSLGGLLASRPVGGSGAVPAGRTGSAPQMEDIKPGMTADKKHEILQHAVSQLGPEYR
jgi:hypothetical protein